MNHGIAHLDNIWGMGGGNRPVKYLTNKVSYREFRLRCIAKHDTWYYVKAVTSLSWNVRPFLLLFLLLLFLLLLISNTIQITKFRFTQDYADQVEYEINNIWK